MRIEKRRILLVGDSEHVRAALLGWLEERYECLPAGSAEEAIEIMRTRQVDVVLTDIGMPGISGIELTKSIRESFTDTVVVVMSVNKRAQYEASIKRLGAAFGYLEKPFNQAQLFNMLAAGLDSSSYTWLRLERKPVLDGG